MCSTKIFLAMILNEIKCHVNTFLGLVGGMHPLHPRPVSAPECSFVFLYTCFNDSKSEI